MEDGVSNSSVDRHIKMGATGNLNAARLATLQERKKTIEDSLAKCTQELRQLCIQEADLTGTFPLEMPLEPGESPPSIRRRVGTAYQLPESLIKNTNNKNEPITDLELQVQLHANLAEAALGLSNEQNISKTLRRQHMAEYQQHKIQFSALQKKLAGEKDKMHQQQQQAAEQMHNKQKKKPRPSDQEDNISLSTNINEPFGRTTLRHSMRSTKCSIGSNESEIDQQQRHPYSRMGYSPAGPYPKPEELLATGLYRLSINGYKNYMERRENMANLHMSYSPQHGLQYSQHHSSHMQLSPHYQSFHQAGFQYQRTSQSSLPQLYNYPPHGYGGQQQFATLTKGHGGSPTGQVNTQLHRQSSPNISNTQKMFYPPSQQTYRPYSTIEPNYRTQNPHQIQPHQQYEHNVMTLGLGGYWKRSEAGEMVWCTSNSNTIDSNWQRDKRFGSLDRRKNKRLHKKVSPNVDSKSATLASVPSYSDHVRTASIKSPQVITRRSQDNRQLVRTQSLGSVGAQTVDSVWPSDDNSSCESDNRSINGTVQSIRKLKQKEWLETSLDTPVSPSHSIISRSQSAVPLVLSPEEKYVSPTPQQQAPPQYSYPPQPPKITHSPQFPRPQSQIPHSPQLSRSPQLSHSPQLSSHSSQHSQIHTPIAAAAAASPPPSPQQAPPQLPPHSSQQNPPPLTPKPPLEIPAESNPSPRVLSDTNIEIFNNNMPKNCTVVQAGHCKPYHEETKPFEMSDFYKYSTKYKKSPVKAPPPSTSDEMQQQRPPQPRGFQNNLNESFDEMSMTHKTMMYQSNFNQGAASMSPAGNSLNSSLDISHPNIAEHFSDEMNAWYTNHKLQIDNTGGSGSGTTSSSKGKSTATLV